MQDTKKESTPPAPLGIPSTDAVMKSTTPTRRAGLTPGDQPAPKPKQTAKYPHVFSSADLMGTPATTESSLGSRVSDGRDVSRSSFTRGGYREDAGEKSGKKRPSEGGRQIWKE